MSTATATERIVPEQVIEGEVWPFVGVQYHIRVKVRGEWLYTTRILKPGQDLVELVKETRKVFRKVA
jgi:hypothetical protein